MEVKKAYKLEVDEELRVEVDCPKNEKVWNVYKNGGGIKSQSIKKADPNFCPSRIQKQQQKRGMEINMLSYLFL
jgi:hypothetical protein